MNSRLSMANLSPQAEHVTAHVVPRGCGRSQSRILTTPLLQAAEVKASKDGYKSSFWSSPPANTRPNEELGH